MPHYSCQQNTCLDFYAVPPTQQSYKVGSLGLVSSVQEDIHLVLGRKFLFFIHPRRPLHSCKSCFRSGQRHLLLEHVSLRKSYRCQRSTAAVPVYCSICSRLEWQSSCGILLARRAPRFDRRIQSTLEMRDNGVLRIGVANSHKVAQRAGSLADRNDTVAIKETKQRICMIKVHLSINGRCIYDHKLCYGCHSADDSLDQPWTM